MAKKKSSGNGNSEALGLALAANAAIGLAIVTPLGPLLLPLGLAVWMHRSADEDE